MLKLYGGNMIKWLVIFLIGCIILIYSYKVGYEVGKRSIITNPKGTIENLIQDFKHITHIK